MTRLGVTLLIFGLGAFLLPMFGMQFRLLQLFGEGNTPFIGGGLIAVGLLIAVVGFSTERGEE